jgi:hypothetical protein
MDQDDQAGKSAKGRARQTVSDKRQLSGPSAKRKKANMNIRTAILYRKNFATLIEESVSGPSAIALYLFMTMPGTGKYLFFDTHIPYRRSCSPKRAYATSVYRLRVLGKLQM